MNINLIIALGVVVLVVLGLAIYDYYVKSKVLRQQMSGESESSEQEDSLNEYSAYCLGPTKSDLGPTGTGICNSLSEYYDKVQGCCLQRPKMVEGANYGGGSCLFDCHCGKGGVCDRYGECHKQC